MQQPWRAIHNIQRDQIGMSHYWQRVLVLTVTFVSMTGCVRSPAQPPYAVMIDVTECRLEYERECLYFYENNWLLYRKTARDRGFISGYQLLRAAKDSAAAVTLVLLTEYPDSLAFARVEDNFQPMMKELRPNGPTLLNGVQRKEFVVNQTSFTLRPLNAR
jgi:hypothetical protein